MKKTEQVGVTYQAHIKTIVRRDGRGFFGPGLAQLLELIAELGSVKDACREMEMSYSKGRMILKKAEDALGFKLIEIRRGGSGGGAAALSEEGEAFLRDYRAWEEEVKSYAQEAFERKIRSVYFQERKQKQE